MISRLIRFTVWIVCIYGSNCLDLSFFYSLDIYWIATLVLIETVLLNWTAGAWNFVLLVKIEFFCAVFVNLIVSVVAEHVKFYLLFSLKSWHKLMRFWVTQRNVRYMINMARMRWRREWVVVVVHTTHSTYSNPSLVAAHSVVSCFFFFFFFNLFQIHSPLRVKVMVIILNWKYLWTAGGSSRGRRQRRGEDVIHPLKVSLEDLYNGTSKKLSLSRSVICTKCKGLVSKYLLWWITYLVSNYLLWWNIYDVTIFLLGSFLFFPPLTCSNLVWLFAVRGLSQVHRWNVLAARDLEWKFQ